MDQPVNALDNGNVPYAAVQNLFEQAHSQGDASPRRLSAGGHLAPGVSAESVANSGNRQFSATLSGAEGRTTASDDVPVTDANADTFGASHRDAANPPTTARDKQQQAEGGQCLGRKYPLGRDGYKEGSLITSTIDPYAPCDIVRSAIVRSQDNARMESAAIDGALMGITHLGQRALVDVDLNANMAANATNLRNAAADLRPFLPNNFRTREIFQFSRNTFENAVASRNLSPAVGPEADAAWQRFSSLRAEREALPQVAAETKAASLRVFGAAFATDLAINHFAFKDSVQTGRTSISDILVPTAIAMTPLRRLGLVAQVGVIAAAHVANRALDYYEQHGNLEHKPGS